MAPLSYYRTISFMYVVIPEPHRRRGERGEEPGRFFDFPNLTAGEVTEENPKFGRQPFSRKKVR